MSKNMLLILKIFQQKNLNLIMIFSSALQAQERPIKTASMIFLNKLEIKMR